MGSLRPHLPCTWTMSRSVAASSRRQARWLGVPGFCALLLAARAAFAQAHEPVTLKWDAPTACGSAEEVEARIRRLLGPTRVSTSLRAEATITPNEAGDWHLKLLIYAGDLVGERNLDGKSCDDLAGAAAVALTLLLTSDQPP